MIVYLAHPVAPTPHQMYCAPPGHADVVVASNLDSARRWLAWLVRNSDMAVSMPWMPYVEALGEDGGAMRERGLRDDCEMAARCDGIVLCGGRVSSGMFQERAACIAAGLAIIDLTDLGEAPPDGDCAEMLRGRVASAMETAAR